MELELEKWLDKPEATFDQNGTTVKFFSIYEGLAKFLQPKHEETTKGAIIDSIEEQIKNLKEGKDKGDLDQDKKEELFKLEKIRWLNDHGPNHIKTVVKRAGQLLGQEPEMSPREVFCLLSAIQLHDLGNFYGRVGHEQRIMDIVHEGQNHIGSDRIERKHILQIAEVHGGTVRGTSDDKDTISSLKIEAPVYSESIRLRFIAAVLRFADELADDKFRADVELLKSKRLPKSSEVFHAYSACLHSVLIKHEKKTVELHFDIDKNYLAEEFGKNDTTKFLIEEIYERVQKVHTELLYCSRFWKTHIDLEKVLVIMNFYSDDIHEEVHPEITFTISETGYPRSHQSIYELCPQSLINDGNKLDGKYFQKLVTKEENEKESV